MHQSKVTSMGPWVSTCVAVLLLFSAGDAVAQNEPSPPSFGQEAPTGGTGFLTLDRGDPSSFVDVSLATSFLDDRLIDADLTARLDLYGQYVAQGGTGGYVGLPVSYLSADDESATAIGNIELGGLHNLQIDSKTSVVLRGGLTLPTASEDSDKLIAALVNINSRYTDLVGIAPEVTTLRLSASPTYRTGQVFLRADGGIDALISTPDGVDGDPLIRVNLAAGLSVGKGSVAFELVTIGTTGDVSEGEDRFVHTIALSGRYNLGSAELFGGLVLPTGTQGDLIDMSLAGGARIPLRF